MNSLEIVSVPETPTPWQRQKAPPERTKGLFQAINGTKYLSNSNDQADRAMNGGTEINHEEHDKSYSSKSDSPGHLFSETTNEASSSSSTSGRRALQSSPFEHEIRHDNTAIVDVNHGEKTNESKYSLPKYKAESFLEESAARGARRYVLLEDATIVSVAMAVLQILLALVLTYGAYYSPTEGPNMEPVIHATPEAESLADKSFSILATYLKGWGLILERHG
jgi:hypothetical protein